MWFFTVLMIFLSVCSLKECPHTFLVVQNRLDNSSYCTITGRHLTCLDFLLSYYFLHLSHTTEMKNKFFVNWVFLRSTHFNTFQVFGFLGGRKGAGLSVSLIKVTMGLPWGKAELGTSPSHCTDVSFLVLHLQNECGTNSFVCGAQRLRDVVDLTREFYLS